MNSLSQAGRSVLVKSTLQSTQVHRMNCFIIPVSICNKLEEVVRDFWWCFKEDDNRHLYLKAWIRFATPESKRGRGFRKTTENKKEFISK